MSVPRIALVVALACVLAPAAPGSHALAAPSPRLVLPRVAAPLTHDPPPRDIAHLHDPLDEVLRADVRDGVVDWRVLRSRDRARLELYLDAMSRVDAESLEPADRTAYWLNVYDATFLMVACAEPPGWAPSDNGFGVFHEPIVRLREGDISLDSLERGIIRPRARDPRVHVALWCGARSCPPLASHAWRGADLDRALASAMKSFLSDPARNRFDRAHRTARLSRVFDWYAADFGGPAGVRQAVAFWTGRDLGGWKIEFQDYDWRLADVGGR